MTADKDEGHAWNGRDDPTDGEEVGSDHEHSGRDELDHEGVPHVPPVPAGPAGGSARGVEKATGRALEEAQDPLPDVDDSSDLRAVVEERSAFWAGPLPEPSTLRAYDEIVPGAAERIIRVHESQTVRVADREDRIISAEIELSRNGQGWAGFLALVCLAAAIVFIARGNNTGGGIMLGMPVLLLIGSFLPSRRSGGGRRSEPSGLETNPDNP